MIIRQTDDEVKAGLYPSNLWNAMIHPFVRLPIYGAIWYQGEANARPGLLLRVTLLLLL